LFKSNCAGTVDNLLPGCGPIEDRGVDVAWKLEQSPSSLGKLVKQGRKEDISLKNR
jgi:hypothetical protein